MLLRTITKNVCFVISACFAVSLLCSCSMISFGGPDSSSIENSASTFGEPEVVARISSEEITESSGLAVSKCQKDVFWTHNDSGGGPFIYAFNSSGAKLGTWRLSVTNIDWEDMATVKARDGACYLYVGEIGDNERKREVHSIFRIREPKVAGGSSTSSRNNPLFITDVETVKFRYPDGRHDAEALMVHPASNAIYVVTKEFGGPSEVFKLNSGFDSSEVQSATRVAAISLPAIPNGFVTGGDISPDGKHVVLCDYYAGYELVLPDSAKGFDEVWAEKLTRFDLGVREIGESVAYAGDENTVFATTEKPKPPLIRVIRKEKTKTGE